MIRVNLFDNIALMLNSVARLIDTNQLSWLVAISCVTLFSIKAISFNSTAISFLSRANESFCDGDGLPAGEVSHCSCLLGVSGWGDTTIGVTLGAVHTHTHTHTHKLIFFYLETFSDSYVSFLKSKQNSLEPSAERLQLRHIKSA